MNNYKWISLLAITAASSSFSLASETELGRDLYDVYCAQCHGIEGDGYGINTLDMEVLPKDHTDTAEMMTRTDEDLFKAIKFGGKAVSKSVLMPNWDANLNDDEIWALVNYLRTLCCAGGN
ncbi:MAG TPA: cytochrome C class I [Oceanospirillaceae bacterium]|nr:cytochrome C class I [Oceanospirillaceae bacterium]